MAVPNQRKIIIERTSDKVQKDFFKVSNDSLEEAMFNLSNNEFKLWVYLADNAHGYQLDLYPVDFCKTANLSISTYRRDFKKLIEKGYLIKSKKAKDVYLFKEKSDKVNKPDVIMSMSTADIEKLKKELF